MTPSRCGGGGSRAMARWTSRRFSTSFRSARVSLVGQKDGEPQRECPWPPPLPFMCAARRGPTSLPRARRPRSGRELKAQLAVGPTGGDQSNNVLMGLTLFACILGSQPTVNASLGLLQLVCSLIFPDNLFGLQAYPICLLYATSCTGRS